jgi:CheY-like chemotaxis protein
LSILVVEDEAPVAAVTGKVLEADGHAVTVATDGPAALDILVVGDQRFDVLVTDDAMPEVNGVELAGAVWERVPDLGVVLSGGFLFKDAIDTQRYLPLKKLFTSAQLTTAVDRAFRAG